jgi:hypothetical protein
LAGGVAQHGGFAAGDAGNTPVAWRTLRPRRRTAPRPPSWSRSTPWIRRRRYGVIQSVPDIIRTKYFGVVPLRQALPRAGGLLAATADRGRTDGVCDNVGRQCHGRQTTDFAKSPIGGDGNEDRLFAAAAEQRGVQ